MHNYTVPEAAAQKDISPIALVINPYTNGTKTTKQCPAQLLVTTHKPAACLTNTQQQLML